MSIISLLIANYRLMAKVILHIGAHKTASTHLQYNLELNRDYLEGNGITYFTFFQSEALHQTALRLRRNLHQKTYDVEEAAGFINAKVNEQLKETNYAIISYEGIMGDFNLHRSKAIYPDAEALLKLYAEILNDHDIMPAFSVRRYVDFILSTYKYQLKRGLPLRLSEYLKGFYWNKDRWTEIVEALDEHFSHKRIWSYEGYKQDPDQILYWLVESLDTEIGLQGLQTSDKKKNTSAGNEVVNYHYAVNRCLNNRLLDHMYNTFIAPKDWRKNHTCRKINLAISNRFNAIKPPKYLWNCMDIDLQNIKGKYQYKEEMEQLSEREDFFNSKNITIPL
jgi:hypothetical protein